MTDPQVGWSNQTVNSDGKRVVKVVALFTDTEPLVTGKLSCLVPPFIFGLSLALLAIRGEQRAQI